MYKTNLIILINTGNNPQEHNGDSIQETVQELLLIELGILGLLGLGGLNLGTGASLQRSLNGLREKRFFLLLGKD